MTWRITSPCYRLKSKSFQTQLFLSAIFLSPRSTSRAKSALLSCTAIISVAIWSKRETVSQICRTWFPSLSHIQASFQRVRLASRWDGKEAITEQSQAQLDYRSKYLQPRWTLQVFSFFWRKLRLLVLLILLGCPSFYQTSFSAVFGLFERERDPFVSDAICKVVEVAKVCAPPKFPFLVILTDYGYLYISLVQRGGHSFTNGQNLWQERSRDKLRDGFAGSCHCTSYPYWVYRSTNQESRVDSAARVARRNKRKVSPASRVWARIL